jgi:hypothetical protein
MTIQKTHSLETVGGVSLASGEAAADGAGVKRMPETVDGLSLDLLDALTVLAQDQVRAGGRRVGRGRGGQGHHPGARYTQRAPASEFGHWFDRHARPPFRHCRAVLRLDEARSRMALTR